MTVLASSRNAERNLLADRWGRLCALAVAALLAGAIGCTSPPPLSRSIADTAPDSLGLDDFMALVPEARTARRERAVYWRRQADRMDATGDRLHALNAAAGLAPDDPHTWLELAEIWSWAGNHLQAETSLTLAATAIRRLDDADYDVPPDDSARQKARRRTALLRAWLHYDRAEWREGLDWVRAAVKIDPGYQEALQIQGLLEASLRHRTQAHEIAADLRRLDMFDPAQNWILAILDRAEGEHRQAFGYVEHMRPDPERAAEAWRDMGWIAEQLAEWSYAERWFNESRAALPVKRASCLGKARHPRLGPPDRAQVMPVWLSFDRYFVTGSLSAYTALALARFHAAGSAEEHARWGGAVVDAVGILLRREEEVAWALRARGLVFVELDRPDRGLDDMRKAERMLGTVAKQDPLLQAGLGHAWLARHDPERALPYLRRAVGLDADLAPAWSDLGLTRIMTGDRTGAHEAFSRALELDAELITAWYNRGLLNLHADDLAAAQADLAEAARLAPTNTEIVQLYQQVSQRIRELNRE